MSPNKPILSDKSMSSCLLQKTQKPRQHTFAPDQGRYMASAMRSVLVLFLVIGPIAFGGVRAAPDDFVITITANDLYLCGMRHGGMHGCIDEAKSREAVSIKIRASNKATTKAVQDLVNAIRSAGFEDITLGTVDDEAI